MCPAATDALILSAHPMTQDRTSPLQYSADAVFTGIWDFMVKVPQVLLLYNRWLLLYMMYMASCAIEKTFNKGDVIDIHGVALISIIIMLCLERGSAVLE